MAKHGWRKFCDSGIACPKCGAKERNEKVHYVSDGLYRCDVCDCLFDPANPQEASE